MTGQRENEVGRLEWTELDLPNKVWNLPGERAKNRKGHSIHLGERALEIIQGLPQINESKFVFTVDGAKPFGSYDSAKQRVDRLTGFSDWRIHDLRRTATTLMARLGIPPMLPIGC